MLIQLGDLTQQHSEAGVMPGIQLSIHRYNIYLVILYCGKGGIKITFHLFDTLL